MTEGLLLIGEFVLLALLLLGVRRMTRDPRNTTLGLFAYKEVEDPVPPATKGKAR